jgi:hypothetical protein
MSIRESIASSFRTETPTPLLVSQFERPTRSQIRSIQTESRFHSFGVLIESPLRGHRRLIFTTRHVAGTATMRLFAGEK